MDGWMDGSLRDTFAQGGSWFASTPSETLAGLTTVEVNWISPAPRIAGIHRRFRWMPGGVAVGQLYCLGDHNAGAVIIFSAAFPVASPH